MSEPFVAPETGEVRSLGETWVNLRARAERFRDTAPDVPAAIDQEMREIEALCFDITKFQAQAQSQLDEAKRVLNKRLSILSEKYEQKGRTQTMVNRLAEADAEAEMADVSTKQIVVDYARRTARVLSEKHYGLMNTNKGIQGMVGAGFRRNT